MKIKIRRDLFSGSGNIRLFKKGDIVKPVREQNFGWVVPHPEHSKSDVSPNVFFIFRREAAVLEVT